MVPVTDPAVDGSTLKNETAGWFVWFDTGSGFFFPEHPMVNAMTQERQQRLTA
jgi:hypothetical protein